LDVRATTDNRVLTSILLGRELQPSKVDGPHGRRADITDLARLNEVVEGLHGLLQRGVVIEAVNLEQVNVLSAQAAQRGVDLVEDGGARQVELVDVVLGGLVRVPLGVVPHLGLLAHAPVALCHDDDFLARDLVLAQRLAHNLLANPVGVHVGRVPRVEAAIIRGFQQGEGLEADYPRCQPLINK
jgi:hypothetical protein